MSTSIKKIDVRTILAAWALVALLGLPAYAGRRSKKRAASPSTTTTAAVTPSVVTSSSDEATAKETPSVSAPSLETALKALSILLGDDDGDINPSSVALVDSDFELSVDAKLSSIYDVAVRDQVQAKTANKVAKGRSVVVAVLDTGFTRYCKGYDNRMSKLGYDFVDRDDDPYDDAVGDDDDEMDDDDEYDDDEDERDDDEEQSRAWGHGTMVAAMVLNAAPRAEILPLRVRDAEGHGSDEAIVDAIYYAMKAGARVINLSLTKDIDDGTWIGKAVQEAQSYGIVVVASTGNDCAPFIPFDAALEANLLVGAVDRSDVIAPFSNWIGWERYGYARVVFAPGADVEGPMLVHGKPSRCVWSGTSFSAGLVSGAAALAFEMQPDLTADAVAELIAASGDPVRSPEGNFKVAGRRVNLQNVVSR